jgi:hypothetical protein
VATSLEHNLTETETNKETEARAHSGTISFRGCTLSANEHTRWDCGHVTSSTPRIAVPLPPCRRSAIGATEDTALLLGACHSCRSADMGRNHLAPKLAHRLAKWASALTTVDQAAMSDSFTPHSSAPTHRRPRMIAATHIQRHWQPTAAHSQLWHRNEGPKVAYLTVTTPQLRTVAKSKPQHNLA